jgi:hypothetical protein
VKDVVIKNKVFFLSCLFTLTVFVSLRATETVLDASSYIYIAEDAQVYGKEQLFAKPKNHSNKQPQKIAKTKEKEPSRDQENIKKEEKEDKVTVFPDFPFAPSSSSYLQSGSESAAVVLQQRTGGHQSMTKANRESAYSSIENSDLSLYIPKQRQKLSIAATQCGVLTSFSPKSPTE